MDENAQLTNELQRLMQATQQMSAQILRLSQRISGIPLDSSSSRSMAYTRSMRHRRNMPVHSVCPICAGDVIADQKEWMRMGEIMAHESVCQCDFVDYGMEDSFTDTMDLTETTVGNNLDSAKTQGLRAAN